MVLVTVGGQLAGALAWLAISGEDAPDLVATAPVTAGAVTRAKVEAVMGAVALVLAPSSSVLALLSPYHALAAAVGIAARRRLDDPHPALVPGAGQAQPLPPPPYLLADRDLRRGAGVVLVGRPRPAWPPPGRGSPS